MALAVHRQPELATYKRGTRLKLKTGETVTTDDVRAAHAQWGELLAYIDALERSVVRSPQDVMAMPAKYMYIRALAGFNATAYQQESTAQMLRAIFGSK